MKPPVTIVLHLEGGRERALRCLRSIAALKPEPAHEVVVVDDASSGLEGLLASLEGDLRILRNERRSGFVASAVRAAEVAEGEVVVLLLDAPELASGALGPLVAALDDPDLAAAAAALPGKSQSHPVCSRALALRREDAAALHANGIPAGLELAAVCADLGSGGRRVEAVPTSIVAPAGARATSSRGEPGREAELTIVIPTLDAASERVRSCVAAVQSCTEAPHQIVLVDNGAPPQGFTAPVNAGLRAVSTPYAVVMNDDVEPLPGWWQPLRDELDAGADIVFPLTVEGGMRTDFAAWCFGLTQATIAEFGHGPGEFFDPALRVWYQDTDLLERLRAAGRPPRLVREARIRHGLSQTVASEDPQLREWIQRTVREDREAFLRKHPGAVAVG